MSRRNEYDSYRSQRREARPRGNAFSGLKLRLIIGAVIVVFTLVNYAFKGEANPITGERQRVDMTIQEEIILGSQSVAQMGQPTSNYQAQNRVDRVGKRLLYALDEHLRSQGKQRPYPFEFHLLADAGRNRGSVNAFALPGGQVFITETLYRSLDQVNDGPLAGVLGHEIGHVLERHGAQRMAHGSLLKGIAGAAGVAGGSFEGARAASAIGNLVSMKYGREDELQSDRWGVRLMVEAGYNPEHLLTVMDVLESTAGGGGTPEFLSTHPRPANRREYIEQIISKTFPAGIPAGLK